MFPILIYIIYGDNPKSMVERILNEIDLEKEILGRDLDRLHLIGQIFTQRGTIKSGEDFKEDEILESIGKYEYLSEVYEKNFA